MVYRHFNYLNKYHNREGTLKLKDKENDLLELVVFLLQQKLIKLKVLYPTIKLPSEYSNNQIKKLRENVFNNKENDIKLNDEKSKPMLTIEKYLDMINLSDI